MLAKLSNYAKFYGRMKGVIRLIKEVDADPLVLVPDDAEAAVEQHFDRAAFIFEGQTTTFGEFDAQANRIANWALEQGFAPGDTVALIMENCPDFIAVWVGLSKIGVVAALINTNLEGVGLVHCVDIVQAKAIVASGVQAQRADSVLTRLKGGPPLWDMGGQIGSDLRVALEASSDERPARKHRAGLKGTDACVYIYTSGTTGLPKAARISHDRMRRAMRMAIPLGELTQDDIVYNSLPLYHITGGAMAIGSVLNAGAAMHIRRKFSATGFWDDVAESGATAFVYIGEFCRYLVNSPEHPKERSHKLRVGFGNGLRGDVWAKFVERFDVPTLHELYGSTEGNVSFMNLDGKVGAVGQSPRFLDRSMGVAFVRFDVDLEQPIRDKKGFCVKCDANEPGEVLGRIEDTGRATFEGYNDKTSTEKKILSNVFKPGDKWFRTGDLMSRDELGYVYFVDRIGDTFRWKGENVSTNEVADIVSKFPGIELANVFGVEVPNADGRAGMASITVQGWLDYEALAQHLLNNLPPYAVPIFIRENKEADTTGTFKFRKVDAVQQGFDPARIGDPLWVLDAKLGVYKPLTSELHSEIVSGVFRL
ncbi:MAG: long-chain-acyl-CoA synthetase [Pseudomonadota bacterium]